MNSSKKNSFYVTTPIYYVTAKPHLGSLYSTVLADVAARWNKLLGKDVFFLTGTDEHGQKIAQAAEKAGKQPKEFVDSFIPAYMSLWDKFEIDYTHFIRTTDTYHVKAVQQWLTALQKKGDIYKAFYEGWYCTHCEMFVAEASDIPATHQPPLCPTCGRPTNFMSEESYFFKLSAYQDKLIKFYEQHPEFIIPKERAHEVINFVKSGLKDLSISRTTISWGIPFPGDSKHVTYVWADALNNYITGIGYGDPTKADAFKKWWPADLQIMGKDIIRFHAVYWPAFLMASGLELPKHLLVHGWIKVNEQKMSKSFGNVVDPEQLYNQYGAEAVRYYLVRQIAITHDSEFSIADLEQKIATDLANDLGNLLNRMLLLAHKQGLYETKAPSAWTAASVDLRDAWLTMLEEYDAYMENCHYHMALSSLWKYINHVNAYFHAQEPWKVAKADHKLFNEIISATCHSLRGIAILLWPVMPRKMEELLQSIGYTFTIGKNYKEFLETNPWVDTFMLKQIEPLFKKPETAPEVKQETSSSSQQQANQSFITIDDFSRIELRVGTVLECEEVPKSDKLYKLQVDFGDLGKRQVLSGVRKDFAAIDLIGKQGVFIYNLPPRAMMGHESQGMMLFAANEQGKLEIITVGAPVPNGARLR